MTNEPDPFPDQSLDLYVKAALGKKAIGLVMLDVRELTSIADVFIVCSGISNRQVSAIAEYIQGYKRRALGFARLWPCDHSCFL